MNWLKHRRVLPRRIQIASRGYSDGSCKGGSEVGKNVGVLKKNRGKSFNKNTFLALKNGIEN